jgi:hypothetical protein
MKRSTFVEERIAYALRRAESGTPVEESLPTDGGQGGVNLSRFVDTPDRTKVRWE